MRLGGWAALLLLTGLSGVLALTAWALVLQPGSLVGARRASPLPNPSAGSGVAPAFLPAAAPQPTATPTPVVLQGQVLDSDAGDPIHGAEVAAGWSDDAGGDTGATLLAHTDAQGAFTLTVPHWLSALRVTASDFAPRRVAVSDGSFATVVLTPNLAVGTAYDALTGRPIGGATLRADERSTRSQPDGTFRLRDLEPAAAVRVEATAYEPATLRARRQPQQVRLRPREVRGVYLTFFGVGDQGLRENVLRLLERTEVNAVVVDTKGDRGWIAYPTAVPLAAQIGAVKDPTMPDPATFLDAVRRRGGLAIARIVVFKDDPLARTRPDLAVRDARTGGLWVDGEGLVWADPFREEVWAYNIALAVEAARLGFDEVQFDYIRFPTDPGAGTSVERAQFSQPNTEARRVAAMTEFLRQTRAALQPFPVRLSVDVFGYTTWRDDDMGIGQHIEALAPHLDVLAPMVYPSTYAYGLPLETPYTPAARYPYEVVHLSVKRAVERLRGIGTEVRPWLQYFNDYTAADVPYGASELEAQKRAARDGGARGWMFWDPTNRYAKGGFAPRG